MPSVATRRWDTKAPSTLKRNTPGRWPIEQPHTCPPQGVHSRHRANDLDRLTRISLRNCSAASYQGRTDGCCQGQSDLEKGIGDALPAVPCDHHGVCFPVGRGEILHTSKQQNRRRELNADCLGVLRLPTADHPGPKPVQVCRGAVLVNILTLERWRQ